MTDEGEKDPWSISYKYAMEKLKREGLLAAMKFDNVIETDIAGTATKFLDVLLPNENDDFTAEQTVIKQIASEIRSTRPSRAICEQELYVALLTMGRKKVPMVR